MPCEAKMTLTDAIKVRCSRRKYVPAPLDASTAAELQAAIAEYLGKEALDIRLVTGNGEAFAGFRKSYGMFSGVRNYLGLIGKPGDSLYAEKLGYYGELLVLRATALGLGTCWVGGTFYAKACPFDLAAGESVICVIAVGRAAEGMSFKEKFIRNMTHRKSKTVEQMYTSSEPAPDWFLAGMEAVRLAPSAVNRQPVMFTYANGAVTASVKDAEGMAYALDLGIAKLHFELGAGGGTWAFGNGAEFSRQQE